MNKLRIVPLKDEHIPSLWEILQEYTYYFDDTIKVSNLADFYEWIWDNVIEGYVGIVNGEIVGIGYLSDTYKGLGALNIFVKKKSIPYVEMLNVIKGKITDFFRRYDLKMLYGITHEDNRACKIFLKHAGFAHSLEIKNHETIKGVSKDCSLFFILREEVI
jgi:hypothetical protein